MPSFPNDSSARAQRRADLDARLAAGRISRAEYDHQIARAEHRTRSAIGEFRDKARRTLSLLLRQSIDKDEALARLVQAYEDTTTAE